MSATFAKLSVFLQRHRIHLFTTSVGSSHLSSSKFLGHGHLPHHWSMAVKMLTVKSRNISCCIFGKRAVGENFEQLRAAFCMRPEAPKTTLSPSDMKNSHLEYTRSRFRALGPVNMDSLRLVPSRRQTPPRKAKSIPLRSLNKVPEESQRRCGFDRDPHFILATVLCNFTRERFVVAR